MLPQIHFLALDYYRKPRSDPFSLVTPDALARKVILPIHASAARSLGFPSALVA